MKKWLWLAFAVLVAVAAAALFYALTNPSILSGLIAFGLNTLWTALLPELLKRKSPAEEELDRIAARRNQERPTKFKPHPGENH